MPKQLVDFATYNTQISYLTGAIISKAHYNDKYNYVQDCDCVFVSARGLLKFRVHVLWQIFLDYRHCGVYFTLVLKNFLEADLSGWNCENSPSRWPPGNPLFQRSCQVHIREK
jgi:hypothetical protein